MNKRAAVIGASGYTGREILRLLERHPQLQVDLAMTARPGVDPEPPATSYESVVLPLDVEKLRYVDGVFLCTPHGAAAGLAKAAAEHGCKVVDLSADLRLRDPEVHARTYGAEDAAAAELRERAVYGLTEHARTRIQHADLVANPGCYPTAVALPLLPLLAAELVDLDADVVADCKSGVSGAGKTPSAKTLFGNVHENFAAYSVGNHRHAPEIHQVLGTDKVLFVPHLLPAFRGILATIWVRPANGATADTMRACLDDAYGGERFVRVYSRGLPDIAGVQSTNFCDIGVASCGERVLLIATIDNLVKGAAGQAIQNMNLMLGLPEEAGLL